MSVPDPSTTDWVPLWNLGGVPEVIDHKGAWNSLDAYLPGNVVVYNGVQYLAVNPSTGQAPPALVTPPPLGYGTSLPASPVDGQEHVLVDSLTDPTYQWRFRYNAGSSSAYKWEFVGGSPYYGTAGVGVIESTAVVAAFADLPTPGPRLVVPRAGDYEAIGQCQINHSGVNQILQLVIAKSDGTAVGVAIAFSSAVASGWMTFEAYGRANGLTVGQDIRLRYYQGATGGGFANRTIRVTPIRVA